MKGLLPYPRSNFLEVATIELQEGGENGIHTYLSVVLYACDIELDYNYDECECTNIFFLLLNHAL